MKKFTTLSSLLLLIMFCIANITSAQNLALNGEFENWAVNGPDGPPDEWSLSGSGVTASQEAATVYSGTYSTNLTWTTTSTRYLQQFIAVTAGNNYEFSYWALDNDANGRVRVAVRWYNDGGSFVSGYYGDYSSDSPEWQQLSSGSQTAPEGAVSAHIEIRVYDVSWSGTATVYVDEAMFTGITAVEISKAYAISENAVDVLYSAIMTSVDPSDYTLTGTAAITFSGATIDGTNPKLVHLIGASEIMTGDIIVDNIADAANEDNYDFYAGIMPVAYINPLNPGGTMNNDNIATFQGIVSANDEYNNVWVSDAAGAYNGVMIYSNSFDALVAVGDEILFFANRTTYNFLSELESPELISIISSGNSPYGPDEIAGSDLDENLLADTNPGEQWEGQLVKITNATVESYTDYDYRCSWEDGETTYYFHVGDNVVYHFGDITMDVGSTYAITGVVDWYNSGPYFRINPRGTEDIEESQADSQEITLNAGYVFISSYILAENPDMLSVLENNLNSNLQFVRNSQGQIIQNIGGNWINGIGDWVTTEGYLFKMTQADNLTINGAIIDPQTPIDLNIGYQFVSYLPVAPINALDAFVEILNDNLDFIRNSQGGIIQKIGPNWVNGIGDCNPGEGYLIKMSAVDILIYP
jgi:hypothetical protein